MVRVRVRVSVTTLTLTLTLTPSSALSLTLALAPALTRHQPQLLLRRAARALTAEAGGERPTPSWPLRPSANSIVERESRPIPNPISNSNSILTLTLTQTLSQP